VPVADPYRWLEAGETDEVREWTGLQNARTESILAALPGRAKLQTRLHDLLQVGTVGAPVLRAGRIFYLKREGAQNQPVLCARDGVDGAETVVVDPNALDADGLLALDWWVPSPSGRLVAYGTSSNGDEWSTLRVIEVTSGAVLPEAIDRTRYSSVVWQPDGGGSTARGRALNPRRVAAERRRLEEKGTTSVTGNPVAEKWVKGWTIRQQRHVLGVTQIRPEDV